MSYKDNAIPTKLLAWVIMDVWAEDPHGKSNSFRVPSYDALAWREMVHLGAYTIKEMVQKEKTTTSGEETKPHTPQNKKLKNCARRHKSRQDKTKVKMDTERPESYSDEDNEASKSADGK